MNVKKWLRTTLIAAGCLVTLAVALLCTLALLLNSKDFQNRVLVYADDYLSERLQTEVQIDSVDISIWKQYVNLYGLDIEDLQGRPMFRTDTIAVRLDVLALLKRHVSISRAAVCGLDARLYKPSKEMPGNWQFVIDAFREKDEGDSPQSNEPKKKHTDRNPVNFDLQQLQLQRIHIVYNDKELSLQNLTMEKSSDSQEARLEGLSYEWMAETKKGEVAHSLFIPLLTLEQKQTVQTPDGLSPLELSLQGVHYKSDNHLPRKNAAKPKRGFFDVGHLDVTADMHWRLEGIDTHSLKTTSDTIYASLVGCTAVDSVTGIDLRDVRFDLKVHPHCLHLKDVVVQQRSTILSFDTAYVQLPDTSSGREFRYSTSTITGQTVLQDIARTFAPVLSRFTMPLQLQTEMSGTQTDIRFRKVRVNTPDRRLTISADGDITGLNDAKKLVVHFNVHKMQAKGKVKDLILNQFTVKKLMMKQFDALGTIGYTGDFTVKWRREEFRGQLTSVPGTLRFAFAIDENNKYISGTAGTQGFELAQLFDVKGLGPVAFDANYKIDISKLRTAQMRRQKGGKLPLGSVTAKVNSASYKAVKFKNLDVSIESDGATATGNIRQSGKLLEVDCDFTYTSTEQGTQLKVKPRLHLGRSSEDKRQARAEKKQARAEQKAEQKQAKAEKREQRRQEKEKKREERAAQKAEKKAAKNGN